MREIDLMIREEVGFYKDVYKKGGLSALMNVL
jgi:hypothetical protein